MMLNVLVFVCLLLPTVFGKDNTSCTDNVTSLQQDKQSNISPVLEKHQALLLMILGFGGLSLTLGVVHFAIRKYVYRDSHSLDTVFDAGGKVTLGLTAVTVTSQMLWPADFLQSATIMSKYGLGGSLFFAIAIVLDILLFPLLSVTLKTRAPGAKTFLQIINARFGRSAHIVFCVIALLANLITIMGLVLAAKASLDVLAKDISDEMILLVLAFLFGSYCLIGGLGTTFYISYFNTALTFISVLVFVVNVSYFQTDSDQVSRKSMYEAMSCIEGPEGNFGKSFLTFRSRGGIIYGLVLFLMATSLSFCDQANWQSRIAAKPAQGVAGFFISAYLWFAIPLTITMTSASSYISMSYKNNGTHLLSAFDVDAGYITPFVMEETMGKTGAFLLITMCTMALMSTGSGEVMAISSIIVYDIYKVYINPYRKSQKVTNCPLCGQTKAHASDSKKNDTEICVCPSAMTCKSCQNDIRRREKGEQYRHPYECETHGNYRRYEDELLHYKSWCMIWVTIAIIPYGLAIINSGVNLNWAVFTMQGLQSAFLCPLLLTIIWSKCTSKGIISGSIFGAIAYFAGILIVAELAYDKGLRDFLNNTSADYSLLGGIISGGVVSVTFTVCVSLFTHNIKTKYDYDHVWDRTLCVDNPLSPWRRIYEEELAEINVSEETKVNTSHMAKIFRNARLLAIIGGLISIIIFGVIIPASVLSFEVFTFSQFSTWFDVCQIWVMAAAAFAIFVPPLEEIIQTVKYYLKNNQKGDVYKDSSINDTAYYREENM